MESLVSGALERLLTSRAQFTVLYIDEKFACCHSSNINVSVPCGTNSSHLQLYCFVVVHKSFCNHDADIPMIGTSCATTFVGRFQ